MTGSAGEYVLGASPGELELTTGAELREVMLALASQARRSLDIVSRSLDPVQLDNEAFATAVKRLVLGSARAHVRLLVLDPAPLVRGSHRLVPLSQQLSSFISLRVIAPVNRDFNEAWLVADDTGYVHRRLSDRPEATANFDARRESGQLTARFDDLWSRAQPDPNLRRLHL